MAVSTRRPARRKSADAFPSTRLSALRGLHSTDAAERERSLESLAIAYVRPIYCHLRRRWRKSSEESGDLSQEFFAHALEKHVFEHFDPAKGRFRAFLRMCLDRFAVNQFKADGREKRGGRWIHVPFDVDAVELEIATEGPLSAAQADQQFEREWMRGLLDASIDTLRASLVQKGKPRYFEVFDRIVLSDKDPRPSYSEVARELGVSVTDVTNWLAFSRRELRRIVIERLREITSTEEELEEELRLVLGA